MSWSRLRICLVVFAFSNLITVPREKRAPFCLTLEDASSLFGHVQTHGQSLSTNQTTPIFSTSAPPFLNATTITCSIFSIEVWGCGLYTRQDSFRSSCRHCLSWQLCFEIANPSVSLRICRWVLQRNLSLSSISFASMTGITYLKTVPICYRLYLIKLVLPNTSHKERNIPASYNLAKCYRAPFRYLDTRESPLQIYNFSLPMAR